MSLIARTIITKTTMLNHKRHKRVVHNYVEDTTRIQPSVFFFFFFFFTEKKIFTEKQLFTIKAGEEDKICLNALKSDKKNPEEWFHLFSVSCFFFFHSKTLQLFLLFLCNLYDKIDASTTSCRS